MKPGAVFDAHDSLNYVEIAVSHFESGDVDTVAHCGDIAVPFSAAPLDAGFDFHAVRGNNDGEWALRETVESFDTYHGDFVHLTLNDQEIAVYHGMETGLVDVLIDSGVYDFVLHDRDHERVVEHRGATTRVNPGGLPILGVDDVSHVAVVGLNTENTASRLL